jgi:hypothetical protein
MTSAGLLGVHTLTAAQLSRAGATRHRSLHGKPLRKSRTESAAISQELGGSARMAADLHPG